MWEDEKTYDYEFSFLIEYLKTIFCYACACNIDT